MASAHCSKKYGKSVLIIFTWVLLESSKKVQSLNYTKSFHFFPFWGLRAVWPVLYFHLSSRSLRFFDAILADIFKKTKMTCVQIFEDISFSKFQKYLYLSVVSEWTQEISNSNLGGDYYLLKHMSTEIWQSLVKIGLKTKMLYQYAKFWLDPFLNFVDSSKAGVR